MGQDHHGGVSVQRHVGQYLVGPTGDDSGLRKPRLRRKSLPGVDEANLEPRQFRHRNQGLGDMHGTDDIKGPGRIVGTHENLFGGKSAAVFRQQLPGRFHLPIRQGQAAGEVFRAQQGLPTTSDVGDNRNRNSATT